MVYRIGEAAKLAGCKVETVRFYEQAGLLPAPARSGGNFRLYSASQLEQLRFIRHCRSLDMPLEDIRNLLDFRDSPSGNCAGINHLLDEHIERVESHLAALRQLRQQLLALRSRCSGEKPVDACEILRGLADCTCHSVQTD